MRKNGISSFTGLLFVTRVELSSHDGKQYTDIALCLDIAEQGFAICEMFMV